MRAHIVLVVLAGVLLWPTAARAEPGEFRVAGTYAQAAGGLSGELVQVFVPWDGVNQQADILSCLTGSFSLTDGLLTIQRPDRLVKIRLQGETALNADHDEAWELVEAGGACDGLRGTGSYRLTDTPMLRLVGSLDFGAGT